jgi:plasmid stabilization system protein ParE
VNRYVIAPEAREDLKEISRYIAKKREAPQGAKRLRAVFLKQFRLLGSQPLIGELRDDVVFYEPADAGIEIIQIVHGARDLHAAFRRQQCGAQPYANNSRIGAPCGRTEIGRPAEVRYCLWMSTPRCS